MAREAAVIRAEIDQTRRELGRKITRLEAHAQALDPRRYVPDYPLDRAIGAMLTLTGLCMAWKQWQSRSAVGR